MSSQAIVPVPAEEPTAIAKAYVIEVESQSSNAAPTTEDDARVFLNYGAILPPYDPRALANTFEKSTALRPNIDAYKTNIEGFGHRLEPTVDLEAEDADEKIGDALILEKIADNDPLPQASSDEIAAAKLTLKAEMRLEKLRLEQFFENCGGSISFIELRERTRQDLESTGNAYWEVLRDGRGRPCRIELIPAPSMRLMRAELRYTMVPESRRVSALSLRQYGVKRRLRRFVQVLFGQFIAYFKELDDARIMSSRTGKVYPTVQALNFNEPGVPTATEILHLRIHSPTTAYGVPRWVGAMLAVLGSRAAEEVNVTYFDNKAVPPMAILVSGGSLAHGMADRITTYIRDNIKGRDNFHAILVLEAEPAAGALSGANGSRCRIEIKNLMESQNTDALFQEYDANNTEKVGNQFRLPKLLRGDMKDFNRACYSADTETLTEGGWKLHGEIGPDEKIAAFDPTTGRMKFVIPAAKLVYDVDDEELVRVHNKHTDCLVTKDHRMVVRSAQTRAIDPQWETFEAAAIPYRRFEVPMAAASWAGSELPDFLLPKHEKCSIERGHSHDGRTVAADDWLEFLGYFISEGSIVTTDHPAAPYLVCIDQKKPGVRENIRACLDRIGWTYSSQEKKCGTTHFLLSNRCLRDWLRQNVGTHAQDKQIPWEYLNLGRRQLRVLFDAMMAGDGSVDPRENRTAGCYYSSSTVLAGQTQRLLIQLGHRATIRMGTRSWRVMFCDQSTTRLHAVGQARTKACVERVRYSGEVYCFSVPGYGFFVTRRNGKVAIQGNTADAALDYAEQQVFAPERNKVDHLINRRILPLLDSRFFKFVSNGVQVKDQNERSTMIKEHVETGILTPNEGRELDADVFGKQFKKIDAPWADQPLTLSIAQAKADAAAQQAPPEQKSVDDMAERLIALRSRLASMEGQRFSEATELARTNEAAHVVYVPQDEFNSWFQPSP